MKSPYDLVSDLTGLRASYRTRRDVAFSGGDAAVANRFQNMIDKVDKMIAIKAGAINA